MGKCPYCGWVYHSRLVSIRNFDVVKCRSCNLVFTKLSLAHNLEKYNKGYYSKKYLLNYEMREVRLRRRFLKRLKSIEHIKKDGKLLDVGCSTAIFLRTVQEGSKYNWRLFGIDINEELIRFAKTKVKALLFQASLHNSGFKKNYFDCITCFDVLEHDSNIKNNLKEIHRILKPNGLLVIQAPNYSSAMAKLAGKYWDWWSVPDHVLHFSPPTLLKILNDHNFIIKKEFTWEPASEFVGNISGSLKKRIPSLLKMNRMISELSILPLYFIWLIVWLFERFVGIGGLIVVYAIKN